MLKRLAPLVPMSFVLLLAACASHSPEPQVAKEPTAAKSSIDVERDAIAWQDVEDEGADNSSAGTPALASSILERAFELIGTPYRFGGTTAKGFDCSGFVGYLFREEAGIKLPRSTRELIDMDVPLVSKDEAAARRPAVLQQPWPWPRQPRRHLHRRWPVHPFRQPSRRRGAGGQPGLQLLEPELHGSQAGARTRLQGCPDEQALNLKFYFKYCV